MRPTLTTALLVRNEASLDRFLRPVLARCQVLSDKIVALDDGSTDDTVEVCESFDAKVKRRDPNSPQAWGAEASARAELWEWALEHCPDENSWLLVCDSDMLLHGDPRPLLQTRELNTWSWRLYDCWTETQYREDQWWQGHNHARPWLVAPRRVPKGWQPWWSSRGLHPGHLPDNFPMLSGLAPPDIYWIHLAFSHPDLRKKKHAAYLSKADLLSPQEIAHAESILQEP